MSSEGFRQRRHPRERDGPGGPKSRALHPGGPSRQGVRLAPALLFLDAMEPDGWSETLKTGNEALDAQHVELFELHANVCGASRRGEAKAVRDVLQELREQTRRHFAFEAQQMAESKYARRKMHENAHAAFMQDLDSLIAEAERSACSPLVRLWLESRYASWWALHVRSHAMGLAAHLAAFAAAAAAAAAKAAAEAEKSSGADKA